MRQYKSAVKNIAVIMFPICLSVFLVAPLALEIWIDPVFSESTALLLRILSIGIFVVSIGQVPLAGLYAISRPEVIAFAQLFELVLYILALYYLLNWFGLIGAAVCWSARAIFDTFVLHFLFRKNLESVRSNFDERP